MACHLADGCEPCARLVALLGRIHQAGADEVTVPEHLVRSAKEIFPARRMPEYSSNLDLLPRLAARLVFSNLRDPAPEGARSTAGNLVQVIYHAGDYAIELQLEPEPESHEMALVGQVVNRASASEPVPGFPVRLMAGKKLLAATQSNRFGEFCLVSKFQRGLRLSMPMESVGRLLEIPLDRFVAGIRP
ncbi:MAG: hypothetical protein P4L56_17955 [Candidatus Sulfopaludibacter sp.]|nr:hypothetical protein [Candidatus Sulfopaludibacter sp.]